jgi:hypothetical protein
MNQKNIFTGIAVVLLLQGIGFYAMNEKMAQDSFPGLAAEGVSAVGIIITVASMLSILLGLIAYATRNYPGVVWAFALGITLLLLNTLKHKFIDDINVPPVAMIIQGLIALSCIYLWFQGRNTAT